MGKKINYNTLIQRINKNKDPFSEIDISKKHNFKEIKELDN